MATAESNPVQSETVRLGKELIERIQLTLTPEHDNQFIAVDVLTGDYEMDRSDLAAFQRLRDRRPDARMFMGRVGQPTAYVMRRRP